ncbi:MAG: TetR/AcrR family transcriptional regulator [Cyclobacteriaceae bacterium]|nr:TetR/AcrR family transcriptional regulator [Cyclobacteriaceae bacterium]
MLKGSNTREKIVEESAVLFNKKGYDGCSMQDIMQATGLQKGGIYNHFSTKTEIALEAFNYSFDKTMARFRCRLDRDKTSTQKLYSVIDVLASFVTDPIIEGGCPIFNLSVKSSFEYPELRSKAREGLQMLKRYIEIKIEEGIASGEFKNTNIVKEISSLIIMTMEGGIIMSNIYEGDEQYIKTAASHMKSYIRENLLIR